VVMMSKAVVILRGTGWVISDRGVVQRSVEISISFHLHLSVSVVMETQALPQPSHLHKKRYNMLYCFLVLIDWKPNNFLFMKSEGF
jgi:hypothetical protein